MRNGAKPGIKCQGACELQGTVYLCGNGWHPPVPMQVMVHANGTLHPKKALMMARIVLHTSIELCLGRYDLGRRASQSWCRRHL